jgi:hypothetical protein
MATFSGPLVRTKRSIEYTVPADESWGACYVEVNKAYWAIIQDLRRLKILGEDEMPSDDLIRVFPRDDEIVLVADVQSTTTGSFTELLDLG